VIKTDQEIAVLKYANKISSDAHKKVGHLSAGIAAAA